MTKMDHMNYLPLGAHRTNKGAPAYAYLHTPARPGQTPQDGRILLFEEPWPAELDSKLMVSEDGWSKIVGTIAWSSGETTGLNVPKQAQHKGYGALLVELALQCNPDLRDDGKVTTEGQGLLATLGLRASNAPVAESAAPPAPAPAVVPYSTETGLWLVADTPEGRELMRQVPEHPAMWQLDATRRPSMGAGRLYGALAFGAAVLLATGIAASHWVSGAVMAGLLLVLLALLEVVRRRATRDWQRMQDSALAVPGTPGAVERGRAEAAVPAPAGRPRPAGVPADAQRRARPVPAVAGRPTWRHRRHPGRPRRAPHPDPRHRRRAAAPA